MANAVQQQEEAQEALQAKQNNLKKLELGLQELTLKLQGATENKAALEASLEFCAKKLDRASRLIGGLGGEKERFKTAVIQLLTRLYSFS